MLRPAGRPAGSLPQVGATVAGGWRNSSNVAPRPTAATCDAGELAVLPTSGKSVISGGVAEVAGAAELAGDDAGAAGVEGRRTRS